LERPACEAETGTPRSALAGELAQSAVNSITQPTAATISKFNRVSRALRRLSFQGLLGESIVPLEK